MANPLQVLQASGRLGAEQQALYSTLWRPLPELAEAPGSVWGFRAGGGPAAMPTSEASEASASRSKWLVLGRQEDLRPLATGGPSQMLCFGRWRKSAMEEFHCIAAEETGNFQDEVAGSQVPVQSQSQQ